MITLKKFLSSTKFNIEFNVYKIIILKVICCVLHDQRLYLHTRENNFIYGYLLKQMHTCPYICILKILLKWMTLKQIEF